MVSQLLLGVIGVPDKVWYSILIILCIILIVMYIKYRKAMKP